jgi:hypothetical protein
LRRLSWGLVGNNAEDDRLSRRVRACGLDGGYNMTQGRMHTMTQVRDGFSLAHRAALMVASARRTLMTIASVLVVASLAFVGVGNAGPIDELGVLNFGGASVLPGGLCITCNIPVFTPGGAPGKPPTVNITGTPIVIAAGINGSTLTGATSITTTTEGALAVSNALLSAVMEYAPNATGPSGPVLFIAPGTAPAPNTLDISLPEGIAFVPKKPLMALSESFYVANFTGDPKPADVGSVILFPAIAGTSSWTGNILGTIHNTLVCKGLGLADTALLLPVGAATDAEGNVYVANSGNAALGAPSYVTEYSLADVSTSTTGCFAPTNLVGLGDLQSANGVAVDPAGNIFVSDLNANSIFEFSPAGAVLTQIVGKRTNLRSPMGIALSPAGLTAGVDDLYVANSRRGSVVLFSNINSIGVQNLRGTNVLKGPRTRITLPIGVAPL